MPVNQSESKAEQKRKTAVIGDAAWAVPAPRMYID
jgi:hypothetical protein